MVSHSTRREVAPACNAIVDYSLTTAVYQKTFFSVYLLNTNAAVCFAPEASAIFPGGGVPPEKLVSADIVLLGDGVTVLIGFDVMELLARFSHAFLDRCGSDDPVPRLSGRWIDSDNADAEVCVEPKARAVLAYLGIPCGELSQGDAVFVDD